MIVAFDLDGTLANIEHRLYLIDKRDGSKPDWRSFYRSCVNDTPIHTLIRVAEAMWNAGHTIEVWSGRSDEVRPETEEWLGNAGVQYHTLRMRKAADKRKDCVVKAEWFDALEPHERPVLAFDDRQQVVDFWRSRGVLCCQVAPGNF